MAARDNGAVDGTEEFLERAQREVMRERERLLGERPLPEVAADLASEQCPVCSARLSRVAGAPPTAPLHCRGCDIFWRDDGTVGWEVRGRHPWNSYWWGEPTSEQQAEDQVRAQFNLPGRSWR